MTMKTTIPGIRFDLAGTTYIVPPLSLGAFEQLRERIDKFGSGNDVESTAIALDCATAALRRNYPEMTREQVGELVDLGNMSEVMQAAMDAGGTRRKALEASVASSVTERDEPSTHA